MYTCSQHGEVEPRAIVEIDRWGFAHALAVCPKCGRPVLCSTPTILEETRGEAIPIGEMK